MADDYAPDGGPCFDPTCDCCEAWASLDQGRADYIDDLAMMVDAFMGFARHLDGCVRIAQSRSCSCGFTDLVAQLGIEQPIVNVKVVDGLV